MPRYEVEVVGKAGCGCEASISFALDEGDEPRPRDVGAILFSALDPDETDLLDFLTDHRHAAAGYEKITVTAQVKVR